MVLQKNLPPIRRQPGPYRDPSGPELPRELRDQFFAAVDKDDLDALKALLDEHFPDRTKEYAGTYRIYRLNDVLEAAARLDRAAFVRELLRYPFHTYGFVAAAALAAGAKNTLRVLFEHGYDVNATMGATGLPLLAYALPDEDMVRWLVAHGADPNARPVVDTTPLSMAVQRAPPALVRRLLDECGGNVHRGQLLHHALDREPGPDGPDADAETVEVLGMLLDRGAPLHQTLYADDAPSRGMFFFMDHGTPLHKAAAVGNAAAVAVLLARGADAGARSTHGQTAGDWAAAAGHGDVAAVLRAHARRRFRRRAAGAVAVAAVVCLAVLAASSVYFALQA